MTTRQRILRLLKRDYQLRTATETARALKLTPATTSSIMNRMAKRGELWRVKGGPRVRRAWYYGFVDTERFG